LGLVVAALVLPRKLARRSRILPTTDMSEADRLRKSMEELLVQLQEVTREMNARLDTKMMALAQLVEDADGRINELKRLLEEEAARETTREEHREEGTGRRRDVEETVLRLAREGRTELEIAQETGIARGEIELVLALRRKTSAQ
jgi:hypothetical protein